LDNKWLASLEFPLDKIIEAAYICSADERFTWDDLDNRLTLHNRAGNYVAYSHNVANEYTSIGDQSVWTVGWGLAPRAFKPPLERGGHSPSYQPPLEKGGSVAFRYYYKGWRVLSETNAAGGARQPGSG
jgi:hypothetical protein